MPRFEKTVVMVTCAKLKRDLPALEAAPFPGDIGERIYNEVSEIAWDMWKEHRVLLLNHYGLNMADPNAAEFIMKEMVRFLFEEGGLPDYAGTVQGSPRKK